MGRTGLEGSLFTLNADSGGDRLGLSHLFDIRGDDVRDRAIRPYAAFVQP